MTKNIVIIILGIMLLICLINYVIDFGFYLFYQYCRYHIGRWTEENWRIAIKKKAISWMYHTPTVKITDNSRYMLLDMLTGKYKSHVIQSWQTAAVIWGVLENGTETEAIQAKEASLKLLDSDYKWIAKPEAVDCGMLACAVQKAINNPSLLKPAMDETLEVMMNQISKEGMLSYTNGPDNPELYVDTLGLACPFLCMYAKTYSSPKHEEMAYTQLETFHKYGMFPGTSMPNHAFNIDSKLPVGVYGWGRGIGWYVIGLLDSYTYMENDFFKDQVLSWIQEAAEDYKHYQREDGGFGATVQRPHTYDSSATAVLAWFYGKCARLLNNSEYEDIAWKCLVKLKSVTRITGAIDWCQGDTKDIGIFAQTYDIMPFAQGMTLRAIHEIFGEEK